MINKINKIYKQLLKRQESGKKNKEIIYKTKEIRLQKHNIKHHRPLITINRLIHLL